VTALAETVLARLVAAYGAAADPARAAPMAAYMRDLFPFLGIASAPRRALSRQVLAGTPRPAAADLAAVAQGCWRLPEREYQYFACDWLARHARVPGPEFLPTLRTLITTKSWWDTVDALAPVAGAIVTRHPAARATMGEWLAGDELWLTRVALLHQLKYGAAADADWLFAACAARADHRDFFIRKAIGWALRQHARVNPVAVRDFVDTHRDRLSGLSVREALKHL